MNLFYVDIKMQGRNRHVLFKRLKKHKIKVLSLKSLNEKEIIIRVSPKDNEKVFAFFSDMWYNQKIKVSPLFRLFLLIKKRCVFFACLILSLLALFYVDKMYFGFDLKGETLITHSEINAILNDLDIKKYDVLNSGDIEKIKDAIFSQYKSVGFVDVKKTSNKLIIEIHDKTDAEDRKELSRDIVSNYSGEIFNIIVYRGKALKNIGDKVEIGEKLVEGIMTVGENQFETYSQAQIVLKQDFHFEKTYDTDSERNLSEAVAVAEFLCGSDNIIDKNVQKTQVGGGVTYNVTIFYLVNIER